MLAYVNSMTPKLTVSPLSLNLSKAKVGDTEMDAEALKLKLRVSLLRRNVGEGKVSDTEPFEPKCWYRQSYFF
jgi:hypothetical protein